MPAARHRDPEADGWLWRWEYNNLAPAVHSKPRVSSQGNSVTTLPSQHSARALRYNPVPPLRVACLQRSEDSCVSTLLRTEIRSISQRYEQRQHALGTPASRQEPHTARESACHGRSAQVQMLCRQQKLCDEVMASAQLYSSRYMKQELGLDDLAHELDARATSKQSSVRQQYLDMRLADPYVVLRPRLPKKNQKNSVVLPKLKAQQVPAVERHMAHGNTSTSVESLASIEAGYRSRVLELYSTHSPEKLGRVDQLLKEFQGSEVDLIRLLESKCRKIAAEEQAAAKKAVAARKATRKAAVQIGLDKKAAKQEAARHSAARQTELARLQEMVQEQDMFGAVTVEGSPGALAKQSQQGVDAKGPAQATMGLPEAMNETAPAEEPEMESKQEGAEPEEPSTVQQIKENQAPEAFAASTESEESAPKDPTAAHSGNFYDKATLLGQGAFAEVHRGVLRAGFEHYNLPEEVNPIFSPRRAQMIRSAFQVAIKTLKTAQNDEETRALLHREIQITQKLKHPHCVQMIDVFQRNSTTIQLVLELISGGDLYEMVQQGPFSQHKVATVVSQMGRALEYLHGELRGHKIREVSATAKPEYLDTESTEMLLRSVLMSSDGTTFKLVDFGTAIELPPEGEELDEVLHTVEGGLTPSHCQVVGTPGYVAPEVVLGEPYGAPVDLWSLGVMIYMLFTQSFPFEHYSLDDAYDEDLMVTFKPDAVWSPLDAELKSLLSWLLQQPASERPTARDLAQDAWVKRWIHES